MKNEIILFENQNVKLEVNLKEETVWLTQSQMKDLFNVKQSTIAEHISNIFTEKELDETTSIGISDKSSGGRKSKIYNLDVIISVGYRVKSQNGIVFRKWANKILKDYMIKGYAKEVMIARINFAFTELKLSEIKNGFFEGNIASKNLQEKLGYKVEYENIKTICSRADGITKKKLITSLKKEDWLKVYNL